MIKVYHFIINRIKTLRIEIKWCFGIAFLSVLIIELILKNWEAPNDTIYRFGDMFLRFCYSISASVIFFFFNQHIPKEEKKIRTYAFQKDKLNNIHYEINVLLRLIGIDTKRINGELKANILNSTLSNLEWQTKVISPIESIIVFDNWVEYFSFKALRINNLINELMILEDIIDKNTMQEILKMQPLVTNLSNANSTTEINNLFFFITPIKEIYNHSLNALEYFESLPDLYVGENNKARFTENQHA